MMTWCELLAVKHDTWTLSIQHKPYPAQLNWIQIGPTCFSCLTGSKNGSCQFLHQLNSSRYILNIIFYQTQCLTLIPEYFFMCFFSFRSGSLSHSPDQRTRATHWSAPRRTPPITRGRLNPIGGSKYSGPAYQHLQEVDSTEKESEAQRGWGE